MRHVGRSKDQVFIDPDQLGRAVTLLSLLVAAVDPHQHPVINAVRAEGLTNCVQVGPVPVRGELDAVGKARLQILHERTGAARLAPPALPPRARFGPLPGVSSTSPVAILPISTAFCTVSAWRFSPLGLPGIRLCPVHLGTSE